MNLLDFGILAMLILFALYGYYRGFLHAVLSIGAFILSWAIAMALMGALAGYIKNDAQLYNMMLYYTEGEELIKDVELAHTDISSISTQNLNSIVEKASLPNPIGAQIKTNVAKEAFSFKGVTTLGGYFNETIVCSVINIISFLIMLSLVRLILALIINGTDFVKPFPVLRHSDRIIGAGFGAVRGVLVVFAVMMVTPIILIVMPLDFIRELVDTSFFMPFFYYSNFLLGLMPGV